MDHRESRFPPLERKFETGTVSMSFSAMERLVVGDVGQAVLRHQSGDWGDVDGHDWAVNDAALDRGGQLNSLYRDRNGAAFFVTTWFDPHLTVVTLEGED